jgi:hypothetical protein
MNIAVGTYYTTNGDKAFVERVDDGQAYGYVEGFFVDKPTWWEADSGINPMEYKWDLVAR